MAGINSFNFPPSWTLANTSSANTSSALGWASTTLINPAPSNAFKRYYTLEARRSPCFRAMEDEEVRKLSSSSNTRFNTWEAIKPYFLRTRPMYQGAPSPLAHILLLGATKKGLSGRMGNSIPGFNSAIQVGLFMTLPVVPNKHKINFRTAMPGIQLLDFWKEKFPKFSALYDAFVTEQSVNDAKQWAVEYAMGYIPDIIKEREEETKAYYEKENAKFATAMAAQAHFQQALGQHYMGLGAASNQGLTVSPSTPTFIDDVTETTSTSVSETAISVSQGSFTGNKPTTWFNKIWPQRK